MVGFRPLSFITRLASGLIILVVLLGVSSQLHASTYEKRQLLIELTDQTINFSNPTKIKPSGVKDLIGYVSFHPENSLPVSFSLVRELSIGTFERNPFYTVVTANAP